ncbi:MAG: DNA adenine methylase [Sphingomonadales bacterium]|nr:DNA adenine methylase [Sphingomonadales bacterium]
MSDDQGLIMTGVSAEPRLDAPSGNGGLPCTREKPRRPVLRYHGGKWRIATWILSHFPMHKIYVEPFAGAASVLLRKEPAYCEVYNDLDDELVTLFAILRDPAQSDLLRQAVSLTPFSRREFENAYEVTDDPIEQSRRLIVRSFMGFGSAATNRDVKTGFRANGHRCNAHPASDWANYPAALRLVAERVRGVVIESDDALNVLRRHDRPDALHYVDPPYMPEARSDKSRKSGGKYRCYRHELDREGHEALLECLVGLNGMVVLSGYASDLYRDVLGEWQVFRKKARADGARPRTEHLWLNPVASAALKAEQVQLDIIDLCEPTT